MQQDGLEEFRSHARKLLAAAVPPEDVVWTAEPTGSLFPALPPDDERSITVPRAFSNLASAVVCHRDDRRWPLLYSALWRIDRGERSLMQNEADLLVHRLRRMATAIKHDQHRMTAFVRFRGVRDAEGDHYVAWYEPRHRVLRRAASFFVDRFANSRFWILTPDLTLHWDRQQEQFGPGIERPDAAGEDAVENWWRRYYAATFNPA